MEAKLTANFLPFVVEILQRVPLRRHLRRGAGALLLFEVPADIFHGRELIKSFFFLKQKGGKCY